jgi:hypothetical protein
MGLTDRSFLWNSMESESGWTCAAGLPPSGVAATLLEPARLDRTGSLGPNRKGPLLRTAGKPTQHREETSMASTARTNRCRRLRLVVAGAAVVTVLTAAAAASPPTSMGVPPRWGSKLQR